MMGAPMVGHELLTVQVEGSFALIGEYTQSATPYWSERPVSGTSMPGFVMWHCARIMDWGVNAVVRGTTELAASDAWRERVRFDLGHGVGLSSEDADDAALSVSPVDVSAYVAELRSEVHDWIGDASEADLGRAVDLRRACETNPRYITDSAWAEVENLDGVSSWQFLARPCVSHIRVHIGEVGTLLTVLRAEGPSG